MSKILLIDDDLLTIRMYKKVFTFENYHVEVVSSKDEALQKAKDVKPSIILLDIMTPDDEEFQVLEILKNDPETKHYPVIIMANIYEEEYVEIALAKGASKYIGKLDNDPRQILSIVREIIVSTTSSY